MTTYKFGDITLVLFPFTDQVTSKKRPAVVVSSAVYNQKHPDLILMAVTSQIRDSHAFGEVPVSQWKKASLLRPSLIKPIFTTVERGLILRRLGRLAEKNRQALQEALQNILGE